LSVITLEMAQGLT